MKTIPVIVILVASLFAADTPKPTNPPAAGPLDPVKQEVHVLRLRDALKSIQLAYVGMQQAQQEYYRLNSAYQELQKSEAKELGYPEGTTFTPDQSGNIIANVPAPPPGPAPAPPVKAPEKAKK